MKMVIINFYKKLIIIDDIPKQKAIKLENNQINKKSKKQ